ncbi:hypothetical protein BLA29_014746 [Euroglyphus maynei]|uniref:Uncharacterized protein n=1 Tax=Euroglyphus maynei TaxID=6958 RepID=A0A1Y3B2T5_EURMA|nr:hypothetical protein BLA29_014746 [Euroglyphus maynei]
MLIGPLGQSKGKDIICVQNMESMVDDKISNGIYLYS